MEKYYNIHDILTFKIAGELSLVDKFLSVLFADWDIELQTFKTGFVEHPDITISVSKFVPHNQSCAILDNHYYIKEDYFYCDDRHKYAKWWLEMSGVERGNMTARIHSNALGRMLVAELIINHLIWLKLNEKGYPVVHGSGVSKDGRAYVFAGRGAAGKSTLALNLVEKGFKLLSEHFVLMNQDTVLSFPTPFHIMDFNLAPVIKKNMSLKYRVPFQLKQLFHRLTGRRIVTKILPGDVLPDSLADKAKLRAIFLLLPRETLKIETTDKERLIRHLVMNQKLESFPFLKYMVESSYLFPHSNMATYWDKYQNNLKKALDLGTKVALYRVEVPPVIDTSTLNGIFQIIGGLSGY